MDNELVKVSTTLLPMEDIKEILLTEFQFVDKFGSAGDTDKVGGVSSNMIAVAAGPGMRSTVENALKLGGIESGGYVVAAQGIAIGNDIARLKQNHGESLKDLRDELYMLRSELAKQGIITNTNPYEGFIDLFRDNDPVHLKDFLASAIADSSVATRIQIEPDNFDRFQVGEWIAIDIKSSLHWHVCQITEKKVDGMTLEFTPSTTYQIRNGQADVYKSLGESHDGAFSFIESSDVLPGPKEMDSNLTDDTFRSFRSLVAANTGYAYSFRIPEEKKGFLSTFAVQVKAYGSPGAMMCYIIDDTQIANWKNPTKAATDGILLAKSQPLTVSAATGQAVVQFDFYDGSGYPLLNQADTVSHTVRYVAIIEVLTADANNRYELMFLQGRDGQGVACDLELNNIVYTYAYQANGSVTPALVTSDPINAADLYYEVVMRSVVNQSFVPHREAIYTAQFKTELPIAIKQVRTTLRIAREGLFVSGNTIPVAYQDTNSFPFKKQTGTSYDMLELNGIGMDKDKDQLIVGQYFRNISNQNASEMVLANGLYADKIELPVYRCGYDLTLKAWNETYNATTYLPVITDQISVDLPLTAVLPDRIKRDSRTSDRLVFEADIQQPETSTTLRYNRFELQVHWRTNYGGNFTDDKYKTDLAGRIYDLIVSLERGA